ncbi:MAG TPA: 50S ribosomal protein L9 [Firmicutes bacterium]|nr:50S ribosomal protein L9 [Bacillota bacterium]
MKVILKQDVKNLGKQGTLVNVAEGYARNYLIPRGMAEEASDSNLKALADKKRTEDEKARRELASAQKLKSRLSEASIRIYARAGEGGKLFGSITSKDISDAIMSTVKVEVDKKKIELAEPIKSVGAYIVPVRLHPQVVANLRVEIVAEA